jgi:protoporphyrinogen oxidase
MVSPALSPATLLAAQRLRYRDFLTVAVILRDHGSFSDNWVYIHDPALRVGRVQNYKSWSPEMVPNPDLCCYGLEYFCFEGDDLWRAADSDLLALARRELAALGLAKVDSILDGCVVRQPKAYPVYDDAYADSVAILRSELEGLFPTLHVVGRNGMHRYNNQDHAIMTAMLCAQNIVAGTRKYDVWKVNEDAIYQEEIAPGSL